MKYEFHPDALAEYEDAAIYYANCRIGLELRFIAAIENIIKQIIDFPQRGRIIENNIRKCITRVFPYAVFYTIETDRIFIVAVTHTHREPRYWLHRVIQ